jgi:hypothetical protein
VTDVVVKPRLVRIDQLNPGDAFKDTTGDRGVVLLVGDELVEAIVCATLSRIFKYAYAGATLVTPINATITFSE